MARTGTKGGKPSKAKKRSDNLDLREGVYYADFYIGERRIRRSLKTGDYEKAKAAVAVLMERAWKADKLGDATVTFAQATAEYISTLDAMSKPPATLEEKRAKALWLVNALGMSMLVRDVTVETAHVVIKKRRDQGNGLRKTPLSDTTLNRYLAELSAILNFAAGKRWIAAAPKMPMFDDGEGRTRWLTQEQAARLLKELPDHLRNLVRFSLATGLRRGNATHLQWSEVSLAQRVAWVFPDDAKARKAISVPLSDDAMAVLREQAGKSDTWVFPHERKPILNPASNAWKKALQRAGIENFRWHDLRHTWATWHVQNGTPLGVLQKLGGWASYEMVLRYATFAPDHLAQFANNSKAPEGF